MKTIYLVGGTMGVGKTAACQKLKRMLPDAALLDGDWCWDMDPFVVNDETKAMVMDNIAFCLNRFTRCSVLQNIIFCWVMHQQSILDELLSRLNTDGCRVVKISLICRPEALRSRLEKDIAAGVRSPDIVERSLPRLGLYDRLDTIKIDTTGMDAKAAAAAIARCGKEK